MKRTFAITAVLFIIMYAGAMATLPRPAQDGVVHLRWATDPNPARVVQTALFHKMYPNVDVTVDPTNGDPAKVLVQCATGTGPDIMDLGQSSMNSFVQAGILLDVTPYASRMGFDPSKTYPSIKDSLEIDGRQYRFPCNVFADGVIYNKAIFDDHGVPSPKPDWTFDDFVRTARMIQERPSRSGVRHIAFANWSDSWLVENLLVSHGATLFTPDGLHCTLDSPQAIAAMQQYYDMMYIDKIVPTPAEASAMSVQGGWGSGGLNWFSEGKAAMMSISRWYIVQVPNFPAIKGHLGSVAMPRVGSLPSASMAGTRAAGINAKSPHWREALLFLQYLASPEYSKVIVEDGDSLPPNPTLATSGAALSNSMEPDPAFHATFIQSIKNGHPLIFSPYIDAIIIERWITDYVQKVENRLLTPPQAMRELTARIDRQIRQNIERNPSPSAPVR